MKLVTMKELLDEAYKKNYAVGAFNVCNMENIRAVFEAAEELKAPVIVQGASVEVNHAGGYCFVEMVKQIGRDYNVIAAIHLDHGSSFEEVCRCIRYGFTSVMFDGSMLPFEDNIAITKKIVEVARAVGITVEGELGTIGQVSESGEFIENAYMTDPESARIYVESTGVDCIAVAIGNAHGFYKTTPNLDFDRLKKITELTKIPIVMHGGTGIPEDQIKKAISLGVAKINFSTVLRKAYIDHLREYMKENPGDLMITNILAKASEGFKNAVCEAILMCGSAGKA